MALVTIFEEAVYQSVALDVTQIFLGVTHVHLDVSEMLPTRRFQDRRMVYSSHPPHHPSSPNLIFLEVLYFRMWHQLSLQWHEPETKESFTSLAPSLSPNPTHHGFFHIRFKCIFIIPFHRHHFSLNFDHFLLKPLLSITDLVQLWGLNFYTYKLRTVWHLVSIYQMYDNIIKVVYYFVSRVSSCCKIYFKILNIVLQYKWDHRCPL